MTLEDFKVFVADCIKVLSEAKNRKFGPTIFEQTSEANLKATFSYYLLGTEELKTFDVNFFIPEIKKMDDEDSKIKNGKLIIERLYKLAKDMDRAYN